MYIVSIRERVWGRPRLDRIDDVTVAFNHRGMTVRLRERYKKYKFFHGQEPLSGESTAKNVGSVINYVQ